MSLSLFETQKLNDGIKRIDYRDSTQSRSLIDVIAYRFVSLLEQKLVPINTPYLSRFLKEHAIYFPKQLPVHTRNMNNDDKVSYLLTYTQPHESVLIPAISHTLKQMIVDIMCEKPSLYGHSFLKGIEPKTLRSAKNLDSPEMIKALAKEILHIDIFIERYNRQYALPVKESFLAETDNIPAIYILNKDNTYQTTSDISLDDAEVA